MQKSKLRALAGFILGISLITGVSTSLANTPVPPTGEDFYFPIENLEFVGISFGHDGSPLYVEDEADPRFEAPRCGFGINKMEGGLTEWMFSLYEVRRQSKFNVRLAALPNMFTKGILSNAEEREEGSFEYFDKRQEPYRPVRVTYGPIKEKLTVDELKAMGASAPNPTKFMEKGADYFITFKLPHLENSNGIRDVAFVIYIAKGNIVGYEHRLITKSTTSADTKKVPFIRVALPEKQSGLEKYYTYVVCR
ncbi:MAG: hypothetical protein H6624_15165 [Bdellovibrionaceae bacterium]|nr:hypothetical protein [Bdellovibrionales bacterium]MCB9085685.1 hypothetical protein [Pseudobdellovibrionaceae bacterium]